SPGAAPVSRAFFGGVDKFNVARMLDLGTLPGASESVATGINNDGIVCGYSWSTGNDPHAFQYEDGFLRDLGTLTGADDSRALAINESGQVVGTSGGRAFLYQPYAMIDLNGEIAQGTGWVLTEAAAINRHGQIVGTGTLNGQT